MHHHHHHSHEGHGHNVSLNRAFYIGIGLNSAFIVFELIAGYFYNSVALISDAWHNVSDVASLILAFIALVLSKRQISREKRRIFSYGYKKVSILAALINAALLLVAVGYMISESVRRIISPQEVYAQGMIWVAMTGIIINGVSAFVFFRQKSDDVNIKGAFLHLLADTLVSSGVVIAGIVVLKTGLYIIDPVLSIVIAVVILIGTWKLLKQSILMSIDAVPENIDFEKIYNSIKKIPQVVDLHHIHIWALSTDEFAFTAHIVVDKSISNQELISLKKEIKDLLKKEKISHTTLEFEFSGEECSEESC